MNDPSACIRSVIGCLDYIARRDATDDRCSVDDLALFAGEHLPLAEDALVKAAHLMGELEALRYLLREVANSGVESESRQYVTVQINPVLWKELEAYRG